MLDSLRRVGRVFWQAAVFRFVGRHNEYPTAYGYGEGFEEIVRNWRPELVDA
ncbi:Uncharacterized protein MLTONO_p0503 (plasmid) [Mesorhizobium loti]|nr:Uncharacterized protein MLTONO_p0503 [Mesorhizobium loti]